MTRINFNQVSLGLVLGFAAFALFSLSDASAKVIKGALPPFETAFFGAVFGLVILPFLQRRGDRWTAVFETPRTSLWLLRFFAYLLFGDRIDAPTLIGVALIIGSGILTLHRERVRAAPLPPAIAASTPHVGATMLPKNGGGTMPDRPAARIRQQSDAPEQLGT